MKKILFPIVLVSALLSVVSCSKSFDASEEGLAESAESKFFTATTESDNSKTTIVKEEETLKVFWVQDDEISINGTTYAATPKEDKTKATFTKTEGDDPSSPYKAYYPASLYNGTTATLPASQTYDPENPFCVNPMYAESTTKSLSFKNICSVLRITTSEAVTSIEVSCNDKVLNGVFTVDANNKAVMSKTTDIEAADRKVTLTCASDTARIFYIPIPAQEYTSLRITLNETKVMVKNIFRSLSRNKIYKVSFVENGFSVSNSEKVYFSPGNLQATIDAAGAPTAWKFAAKQYTTIGNAVANTTIGSQGGDIDLFGWSSDGTGADENYKKWGINNAASYPCPAYYGNFVDWGTNDDLKSTLGSGWYTMSMLEWNYILGIYNEEGYRDNASNLYKNGVKVCDNINCLILAPDGYDYTNFPLQKEYSNNSSPLTWAQAEAKGLVCLPGTLVRSGNVVEDFFGEICGYYWTSDTGFDEYSELRTFALYFRYLYITVDDMPDDESKAQFLEMFPEGYFEQSSLDFSDSDRYSGHPVRLVQK